MNRPSTLRFVIQLAAVTAVLLVCNYLGFLYVLKRDFPMYVLGQYLFFVGTTLGIHQILVTATRNKPKLFVNLFTALTGGKMFLSLIVILIWVVLAGHSKIVFGVNFLILYLAYTGFETGTLFNLLRKGQMD